MQHSITLKTNEFNPSLFEGLKKYLLAINAKEITINFSAPPQKSLREETNNDVKTRIENAVKNMESGNHISFTGEEFLQLSKLLTTIK